MTGTLCPYKAHCTCSGRGCKFCVRLLCDRSACLKCRSQRRGDLFLGNRGRLVSRCPVIGGDDGGRRGGFVALVPDCVLKCMGNAWIETKSGCRKSGEGGRIRGRRRPTGRLPDGRPACCAGKGGRANSVCYLSKMPSIGNGQTARHATEGHAECRDRRQSVSSRVCSTGDPSEIVTVSSEVPKEAYFSGSKFLGWGWFLSSSSHFSHSLGSSGSGGAT